MKTLILKNIGHEISICKHCGVRIRKGKEFCGNRCEKMFIEVGINNMEAIKASQMRLKQISDVNYV